MSNKHLWETGHPFYGPERSFVGGGSYTDRFDSWDAFVEGPSRYDADLDMDFLYRWDWHDYTSVEGQSDELELFWMMPRKGIMVRATVSVEKTDEPAVRAWLTPRWEYMRNMWSPLS